MKSIFVISKNDKIIGATTSCEIVDLIKNKITPKYDIKIDRDTWEQMWEIFLDLDVSENYETLLSGMIKIFPEYTENDIEEAIQLYDNLDEDNISVEEIKIFENFNDVNEWL